VVLSRIVQWPKLCFTLNDKASGKAIVFRDSFASSWYSFLGQHFREVINIRHYDWDRPLIEREKPDVVIDEILERFSTLKIRLPWRAKIDRRQPTPLPGLPPEKHDNPRWMIRWFYQLVLST
jgi:hypothetical protein